MSMLFKPAIHLMNRLTYPKKLILIGIIVLLVVVTLAFQLLTQSLSIMNFSRKELFGIEYINPLIKIMKNVQEYRKLENEYLLGDASVKTTMETTRDNIDYTINAVDAQEEKLGKIINAGKEWDSIKNKWQLIKHDSTANPEQSNLISYSMLITNIQHLIITACDNSNLTFDPDIDSYYSMDTYCTKIPSFSEEAASTRDIGFRALSKKTLPNDDQQKLVVDKTLMNQFNKVGIKGNLDKVLQVRPSLASKFDPLIQALTLDSANLARELDSSLIMNNFNIMPKDFSEKYTTLINLTYKLYTQTGLALQEMVQERVNKILKSINRNTAISVISLLILAYLFVGIYLSILNSVKNLVDGSEKLAEGDLNTDVELETKDELVQVASSFNTMRNTLSLVINEVIHILDNLSKGDLTEKNTNYYLGRFGDLKNYLNLTVEGLEKLIRNIKISTETTGYAAREISSGNTDLAKRTEQQGAFLEETAASIEEVTATVKQNAENAKQANQLAQTASDVAVKGGTIVGEVIVTMNDINESSSKVADIITVIDHIAFQTNILALNAAVEAARAGEQGRGFAVVAAEVRNLAQRTSTAAQEIKALISKSVENVASGTKLVDQAGHTMEDIVKAVNRVTEIMSDIASASVEQSNGIEQVSQAVIQMDHVTQENSALVSQVAHSAKSMEEEASHMESLVNIFKLNSQSAEPLISTTPDAESKPRRKTSEKKSKSDFNSLKGEKDIWKEF